MIILVGFIFIVPLFFIKFFYPKKIAAGEFQDLKQKVGELFYEKRYFLLLQEIKKFDVVFQFMQFVTFANFVLIVLVIIETKIFYLVILIPIIWGVRMVFYDHLILKNISHLRCLTCQFTFYRDEKINSNFFHPHSFTCDKCGTIYLKDLGS